MKKFLSILFIMAQATGLQMFGAQVIKTNSFRHLAHDKYQHQTDKIIDLCRPAIAECSFDDKKITEFLGSEEVLKCLVIQEHYMSRILDCFALTDVEASCAKINDITNEYISNHKAIIDKQLSNVKAQGETIEYLSTLLSWVINLGKNHKSGSALDKVYQSSRFKFSLISYGIDTELTFSQLPAGRDQGLSFIKERTNLLAKLLKESETQTDSYFEFWHEFYESYVRSRIVLSKIASGCIPIKVQTGRRSSKQVAPIDPATFLSQNCLLEEPVKKSGLALINNSAKCSLDLGVIDKLKQIGHLTNQELFALKMRECEPVKRQREDILMSESDLRLVQDNSDVSLLPLDGLNTFSRMISHVYNLTKRTKNHGALTVSNLSGGHGVIRYGNSKNRKYKLIFNQSATVTPLEEERPFVDGVALMRARIEFENLTKDTTVYVFSSDILKENGSQIFKLPFDYTCAVLAASPFLKKIQTTKNFTLLNTVGSSCSSTLIGEHADLVDREDGVRGKRFELSQMFLCKNTNSQLSIYLLKILASRTNFLRLTQDTMYPIQSAGHINLDKPNGVLANGDIQTIENLPIAVICDIMKGALNKLSERIFKDFDIAAEIFTRGQLPFKKSSPEEIPQDYSHIEDKYERLKGLIQEFIGCPDLSFYIKTCINAHQAGVKDVYGQAESFIIDCSRAGLNNAMYLDKSRLRFWNQFADTGDYYDYVIHPINEDSFRSFKDLLNVGLVRFFLTKNELDSKVSTNSSKECELFFKGKFFNVEHAKEVYEEKLKFFLNDFCRAVEKNRNATSAKQTSVSKDHRR